MAKVNNKLVAARKSNNWSQQRASSEISVDLRTYQRWERGESIPQPYYREQLCTIFGSTIEDLGFGFFSSSETVNEEPTEHLNFSRPEPVRTFNMDEEKDWASSYAVKVAHILRDLAIWNGPQYSFEIQTIVDQEIRMMDDATNEQNTSEEQKVSRRQALVTIAAFPLSLLNWRSSSITDAVSQEFLARSSASITACWHLLRGNGLASVSEIIPQFTPILRTLALYPSQQQETAARLACQSSILQALLAMHRLNFQKREEHCKDAIRYAVISKDNTLHAAALTYLAYTYSFCYIPKQPEKAINIFLDALHLVGDDAPLLKSNITMGLAEAYAQIHEEKKALEYIEQAKIVFPTDMERDPTFIFGSCSLHVLYQWEGKMYIELSEHYSNKGYQQKAGFALLQGMNIQSISQLATAETLIYKADAARLIGDLEGYTTSLESAAIVVSQLKSRKRYEEARAVLKRTPEIWLREKPIQTLTKDVFKQ